MGNCIVSIHVTGSHHNGADSDIDQMAGVFVDELRRKHNVTAASIVSGGENDLLNASARYPIAHRSGQHVDGVPRRIRTDLHTPAETAISDAMRAVEAAGAHPFLTDAVTLLAKARDKVADFVETPK